MPKQPTKADLAAAAAQEEADKLKDAGELSSEGIIAYTVSRDAFIGAVNTLAELPYKQVGNLINEMRTATPIYEEES